MAKLLPYDQAVARALGDVTALGAEDVGLEAALGRVLAEDLVAPRPLPPFTHSAMDGWAVAAGSLAGAPPFTLPVAGESRAGRAAPALVPGHACRIFTGAPLPSGADAVVLQEDTRRDGERLIIGERPRAGDNVRRAGSDLAQGALALPRGTRLGPAEIGVAASLDRARIAVARRPTVTVVATGDELRAPGSGGDAASIPESNSFVVAAAASRVGATTRIAPACADDAATTAATLAQALAASDLCVTIGGASVGDHDLVRPALEGLGATIAFWGVAIKPGKPVGLARLGSARALCLPGNPASATLVFLLFGVPLLRALQGDARPLAPRARLPVAGNLTRRPGREEYVRARIEIRDGEAWAVLGPTQSSGAVTSFAAADALVVVAADRPAIEHGERLPVLRLADVWGS
jgi:molybdopterin molybdotransferase